MSDSKKEITASFNVLTSSIDKKTKLIKKLTDRRNHQLKVELPDLIEEWVTEVSIKQATEVLNTFYWNYEPAAALMLKIFKQTFGRKMVIAEVVIAIPCQVCNSKIESTATSWTDFNNKKRRHAIKCQYWGQTQFLCPECEITKQQKQKEADEKAEEIKQSKAEELKRLRTMPYAEYLETDH